MTASELRKQLYTVLNELAESGGDVTVTHKSRSFSIVAHDSTPFVDRLVRHDTLRVPADELVAAEAADWAWDEGSQLDGIS
ncbi:MAG: hypothetical protein LC641_06230 [Spirochaeta sp.]|nr:hypothetical protein [Spirochaeta sp.]